MQKLSNPQTEGAHILLFQLGHAAAGEKITVVSDPQTQAVGEIIESTGKASGLTIKHYTVPALRVHGEDPPAEVAAEMLASDLVLGLTFRSMAHSKIRGQLCDRGGRYLSLPEYSLEMLENPVLRADYKACAARAKKYAERLASAKVLRVKTKAGTDIQIKMHGRTPNFCPGYVTPEHRLGSPPDVETNVSPLEDGSDGIVVIDGSIPMAGLGLLQKPIILTVAKGAITKIEGEPEKIAILEKLFEKYGPKSRILAEFGVGFNDRAKLCGNMLIDEGCWGTFHFGFGSNSTVGGKNQVSFHLDFIFFANEVYLDGELIKIS